jgi:hypothetical protein
LNKIIWFVWYFNKTSKYILHIFTQ